jgi:tRNA(Arg) A34 adenosine deaminase TadA
LREEIALVAGNVFLDEMVAEWFEMITERLDGIWHLEMSAFVYADDLVEKFGLTLSDTVEPAYMINANIQL